MIGTKLNIFKNEWIDVIFAGRNQSYGAYILRKESASMVSKALLSGTLVFIMGISIPVVVKYLKSREEVVLTDFKLIDPSVLMEIPPKIIETPPTQAMKPPAAREKQVRMPQPVVVESSNVHDSEPPTIDELKSANPGPKTIIADPTADIHIDAAVDEGLKSQQIVESSGAEDIFVAVEVPPSPPGGMESFIKYISHAYQYPLDAETQGVSGRVILSFVVERDGSLTDIEIIRDLGFGTGPEAVRILKNAKKWSPGIQNGRPVRVQYTLPIVLNLAH